jgi:hypothetical protein
LPHAISELNSARGYDNPPTKALVVVGLSRTHVEGMFDPRRLVSHNENLYAITDREG